ncbi:hypothetical protein [Microbacterium aurantiacum]|uniref:Uncharacterized protein n=1 Tax=Microbacterium aurantiacum TaxID=162393 RepID=A0A0M9VMK3_9MICO|nr:hypothetical protein [Microbacterium chocolatum]ANG84948.1 hypothetical protein A8L33_05745 [Microbacterium chocolatum]KOS12323.1 hypothetical protein XI38_00540 [Microbacterium chocolatum]
MSPRLALVLSTATFFALAVFALGMTSLLLDASVIAEPGLGQIPGILAMAGTTLAFLLTLRPGLRHPRPRYTSALWTTLACFLAYPLVAALGILVVGGELGGATAVVLRHVTGAFGVAVAASALLAAVGGIAMVRTRGGRAQWPWEREPDEE